VCGGRVLFLSDFLLSLIMDEEKQEPVAHDAVTSSIKAGEVSVPYSIYTNKEKWMVVGIVALAGFYRYVLILFHVLLSVMLLAAHAHVDQTFRC
jgi:hypothetical protein